MEGLQILVKNVTARFAKRTVFCFRLHVVDLGRARCARITRTLLVGASLACLEMSFVVKDADAVILLFLLEYKTSVGCHNVNTQKVKIAGRDRPQILASNQCETFENLLHIDIAPLRSTLSGILHSKN